jgi:bacterioferritin (cytochrome b1)
MGIANTKGNNNIAQLNSFLRGEISAVETYRIALEKLEVGSPLRNQLEACRASHAARVNALTDKIIALGGKPADGSGPWGAMTKALEVASAVLSDKLAVATLEQGEDHGLADYRQDVAKLAPEARDIVLDKLLPAQEETHRTMSTLKHTLDRQ